MKKNAMLKIAAILLVAVLLTTCAISTTFAKYVTDYEGAEQTARVAKWGIVLAPADDADEDLFAKAYNESAGTFYVESATDFEVLAPGTTDSAVFGVDISGKPEVAFRLSADVDVALENWNLDADTYYCPLVFSDGDTFNVKMQLDGSGAYSADSIAAMENAIANAIAKAITGADTATDGVASVDYMPNATVGAEAFTLTWTWAKDNQASGHAEVQTDVNDTKLGDKAAEAVDASNEAGAPKITVSYSLRAEQIFAN